MSTFISSSYSTTEEMIPPPKLTPMIPSIAEPAIETALAYEEGIYWKGGKEKEG